MNILSDFYCGRIFPSQDFTPSSALYNKEQQKHGRQLKALSDTLSPEQQAELNCLIEQENRLSAIAFEEMFCYAYSLCGKMMLATFANDVTQVEHQG